MLVDATANARNRNSALMIAGVVVLTGSALTWFSPWGLVLFPIAASVFYALRRKTLRRLRVISQPFPDVWEDTLQSQVEYFRGLEPDQQERFRNLMKVFLDEVTITGVRTDVGEMTRALVAASAVIPILGFDDFEYAGLGEVLIYPDSFDEDYQSDGGRHANTLGMIGTHHLSGVMILSKPSLIQGFANTTDKRNVGIHEFAHLVDKADGDVDGVPLVALAGASGETFEPWVRWVGKELHRKVAANEYIDDYAFTNEAEYFAVLSEYFFEAPESLERKNPKLYEMMQKMYHQNPKRILNPILSRSGRSAPSGCAGAQASRRSCERKMRS